MVKILITGGTGSLGKELLKYFKDFDVVALSRDEKKHHDVRNEFGVTTAIGDVRDYDTCLKATYGMEMVIHAAAMKRIEMCEEFPWEAIQTNVIGTYNMVRACLKNKVPKFVLVSTDKACKPINVYGMTKALAEKIVTSHGYNCVRYGNVNNSRGSVLPYWKKLAQEDKLIPVTNPDMTRFLIDFDEAIELVEKALQKMGGCIYVPKLQSANVGEMGKLFGQTQVIGERAGEKLHEELINDEEFRGRTHEESDYFIIHPSVVNDAFEKKTYSSKDNTIHNRKLKRRLKEFLPK